MRGSAPLSYRELQAHFDAVRITARCKKDFLPHEMSCLGHPSQNPRPSSHLHWGRLTWPLPALFRKKWCLVLGTEQESGQAAGLWPRGSPDVLPRASEFCKWLESHRLEGEPGN